MRDIVIERAINLMLLNHEPGCWNLQSDYGGAFPAVKRRLGEADILKHLRGSAWIACRLPTTGMTDRIVIDLDCRDAMDVARRDERYWRIRELLGRHRSVLVWSTPSGYGMRVAYRIPPTPFDDLASSAGDGLLADAFRAAGIDLRPGEIELFPAPWRSDRQLFGSRMPLLNPETLRPFAEADISDRFDEGALVGALDIAEAWHGDVQSSLLTTLRSLPRAPRRSVTTTVVPASPLQPELSHAPSPDLVRLVRDGLTVPHSRYASEWIVGRAMWLWPSLFADLGLPPSPDRDDVARCLVEWLAQRTNGLSDEWTRDLALGMDEAKARWVRRYTAPNDSDGLAPVDRMRRGAASIASELLPTPYLTMSEHLELFRIGRRAVNSSQLEGGSALYRFQIWSARLLRTAKRQMLRGGDSGCVQCGTAQIAARWMERWRYGKAYAGYRRLLQDAGLVVHVTAPLRSPIDDLPGRATSYRITRIEWTHRSDLIMHPREIAPRITSRHFGVDDPNLDEAYHALFLKARSLDPVVTYGRRTADRIAQYLRALHPPSLLSGF